MAYKLSIVDNTNGLNFNVKYENLSKIKRPPIIAKAPNGTEVKERTVFQGQVLVPGSTQRQWVDDNGTVYGKSELKFYYENEEITENAQTKVFEIASFESLTNYTDKFVIDKFYELFPDTNGMKKDIDKEIAKRSNLVGMRKLWEYLYDTAQVARGEFCPASRGFLASDGFIRAILIDRKAWGLEIGVFKEEKIFEHLQEDIPTATPQAQTTTQRKKLKMV
jgi:hypothetical protein